MDRECWAARSSAPVEPRAVEARRGQSGRVPAERREQRRDAVRLGFGRSHEDTPELREEIRGAMKDEVPGGDRLTCSSLGATRYQGPSGTELIYRAARLTSVLATRCEPPRVLEAPFVGWMVPRGKPSLVISEGGARYDRQQVAEARC